MCPGKMLFKKRVLKNIFFVIYVQNTLKTGECVASDIARQRPLTIDK